MWTITSLFPEHRSSRILLRASCPIPTPQMREEGLQPPKGHLQPSRQLPRPLAQPQPCGSGEASTTRGVPCKIGTSSLGQGIYCAVPPEPSSHIWVQTLHHCPMQISGADLPGLLEADQLRVRGISKAVSAPGTVEFSPLGKRNKQKRMSSKEISA